DMVDPGVQPVHWTEILLGLVGGTTCHCQVQKNGAYCAGEDESPRKGASDRSQERLLSETEDRWSLRPKRDEPMVTACQRSSESIGMPSPILALKVFSAPPDDSRGGQQCCQRLCPASQDIASVVPCAMEEDTTPIRNNEVRRGAAGGARFCVLLKGSSAFPAQVERDRFRSAFVEAVAAAAGVSTSRVRVLDVGPPLQALPQSKARSLTDLLPKSKQGSALDTGAGVLRFLDDLDDGDVLALKVSSKEQQRSEGAPAGEKHREENESEATTDLVRVLAVIREPEGSGPGPEASKE
ncbi:unnamed protein product, partial [Polarella glacialis]